MDVGSSHVGVVEDAGLGGVLDPDRVRLCDDVDGPESVAVREDVATTVDMEVELQRAAGFAGSTIAEVGVMVGRVHIPGGRGRGFCLPVRALGLEHAQEDILGVVGLEGVEDMVLHGDADEEDGSGTLDQGTTAAADSADAAAIDGVVGAPAPDVFKVTGSGRGDVEGHKGSSAGVCLVVALGRESGAGLRAADTGNNIEHIGLADDLDELSTLIDVTDLDHKVHELDSVAAVLGTELDHGLGVALVLPSRGTGSTDGGPGLTLQDGAGRDIQGISDAVDPVREVDDLSDVVVDRSLQGLEVVGAAITLGARVADVDHIGRLRVGEGGLRLGRVLAILQHRAGSLRGVHGKAATGEVLVEGQVEGGAAHEARDGLLALATVKEDLAVVAALDDGLGVGGIEVLNDDGAGVGGRLLGGADDGVGARGRGVNQGDGVGAASVDAGGAVVELHTLQDGDETVVRVDASGDAVEDDVLDVELLVVDVDARLAAVEGQVAHEGAGTAAAVASLHGNTSLLGAGGHVEVDVAQRGALRDGPVELAEGEPAADGRGVDDDVLDALLEVQRGRRIVPVAAVTGVSIDDILVAIRMRHGDSRAVRRVANHLGVHGDLEPARHAVRAGREVDDFGIHRLAAAARLGAIIAIYRYDFSS